MAAVKELSEVSGKHLLPGFGDEEEDNEDTITRTVQEITVLFRDCERRLKEIHNTPDEGSGDEVCSSYLGAGGRAEGRGRADWGVGQARRRSGGSGGQAGRTPLAHHDDPPRCPNLTQQAVRKNIEQRVAKQLQVCTSPHHSSPLPILSHPSAPRTPRRVRASPRPPRALPAPSPDSSPPSRHPLTCLIPAQDLSLDYRRGHKAYLAKLKGQEIEEYKPDLGLKGGGSAGAASSTGGGFFDDDEEAAPPVDPVRLPPSPLPPRLSLAPAALFPQHSPPMRPPTPLLLAPTPPTRHPPPLASQRFNSQQTMALVLAEQISDERSKQINQVAQRASELCTCTCTCHAHAHAHAMHMHMHMPCTCHAHAMHTQVAESVSELAGIFKEIQVLVIDQGTILDRIDFNIEMASDKARPRPRLAAAHTTLRPPTPLPTGDGGDRRDR